MKPNEESVLDVILAVWKRRKWLGVVAFLLPFTLAIGLIAFLPSIYRSTATVLVDRQQVPEAFVRPTVTSGLETRLQTISQEVFSRARLDAIMTRFHLYEDLKKRIAAEEVIERMRSDIQLEYRGVDRAGQRGTIAFAVSYRGKDPLTVAQVTNTLASFFIEENLKVRERQAAGTAEFLKVQLAEVKVKLDTQEKQVSQFKKRNLVELPQLAAVNLGMLDRLDTQLRANVDSQTRLAERRELLAKRASQVAEFIPGPAVSGPVVTRDGVSVPGVGPSPVQSPVLVDPAAADLLRLQRELRVLRTRFSDKYPDVVRLKSAIATLEKEIAERPRAVAPVAKAEAKPETRAEAKPEVKTETPAPTMPAMVPNPYFEPLRQAQDEMEADLRALRAEEQRLRGNIATYVGRLQNAPKLEQEMIEVTRDYDSTRELYGSLLKRYEEALLAESMEQRQKGEQFRILDPAVPAEDPIAPNRFRLGILAVALAVGLAAGAIVLAERIRPAFHTVDALRVFANVPVLLSIPAIITGRDYIRHRRQVRWATVAVVLAMAVLVGSSYVIAHGNEYLVSLMTRGRS
ncbi:MAG: hypothetical protein DMD91_04600 [Candidatus Rokuibacteriota bacterium]|nr:MAG: hypothetical protein DMD91_04600 [Candidatus Rokubacteria bacterium]